MPYDFGKLTVLVVEDSPPMLEVIVNALKYLGVGMVMQARNGESGYQQFVKNRPDIVITDWEMEPVDGLELIKWIRRDSQSPKRTVPIIMMTGYAASSRVSEARDKGITEFLVKPFTANELARRIAYVVDNPRDFVETPVFFGPDRRRRRSQDYQGPERRKD
ncbi:MAG: response regulator [Alphaproteobacteria bacterium]|nr:response regulator [Alphaproteobacteria bacterium]